MAAPQQGGFNVNTAAAQGIQQAGMATGAEMGYRPMAITAPSQANLQQYTNPYENQVVAAVWIPERTRHGSPSSDAESAGWLIRIYAAVKRS